MAITRLCCWGLSGAAAGSCVPLGNEIIGNLKAPKKNEWLESKGCSYKCEYVGPQKYDVVICGYECPSLDYKMIEAEYKATYDDHYSRVHSKSRELAGWSVLVGAVAGFLVGIAHGIHYEYKQRLFKQYALNEQLLRPTLFGASPHEQLLDDVQLEDVSHMRRLSEV